MLHPLFFKNTLAHMKTKHYFCLSKFLKNKKNEENNQIIPIASAPPDMGKL